MVISMLDLCLMGARRRLTDELRAAIDEDERSRYAICRAIDLDPAVLSRFMSRQRGLSLETLDKLARLLDLHLTKGKHHRKAKR
jgi:hypothetical protein